MCGCGSLGLPPVQVDAHVALVRETLHGLMRPGVCIARPAPSAIDRSASLRWPRHMGGQRCGGDATRVNYDIELIAPSLRLGSFKNWAGLIIVAYAWKCQNLHTCSTRYCIVML